MKELTVITLTQFMLLTTLPGAEETAQPWPLFRGNPELTGVAANATTQTAYRLKWSFNTGDAIKSSPVVSERLVYVGSDSGKVHALERTRGAVAWKAAFSNAVEAPVLIAGDNVIAGTLGGDVVALNATDGQEQWRFKTGDKVVGSANLVKGWRGSVKAVVVGSYDFSIYALDPRKGQKLWQFESENFINGAPAVSKEGIIFAGCDATMRVLNPEQGQQVKEIDVGAYVAGSVAVDDGVGFVANYEGHVYAVDLQRGLVVWRYGEQEEIEGFVSSPAVNRELVIVGDTEGRLHGLHRSNGKRKWSFRARDALDSSPVIAGNHVFVGSTDGRVYCLDIVSGEKRWSYDIGAAITASVAVVGDWLYVGAEDGVLYAFKATP